jgi:hypothetical protein
LAIWSKFFRASDLKPKSANPCAKQAKSFVFQVEAPGEDDLLPRCLERMVLVEILVQSSDFWRLGLLLIKLLLRDNRKHFGNLDSDPGDPGLWARFGQDWGADGLGRMKRASKTGCF